MNGGEAEGGRERGGLLWFRWRGEWRTGRVPLPPSFSLLSLRDIELWFPLFSLKTRGSFKERRRLYDRAMDGRTDVEIASADHKSTSSDESVPPPSPRLPAILQTRVACPVLVLVPGPTVCSVGKVNRMDMTRQNLHLSNPAKTVAIVLADSLLLPDPVHFTSSALVLNK